MFVLPLICGEFIEDEVNVFDARKSNVQQCQRNGLKWVMLNCGTTNQQTTTTTARKKNQHLLGTMSAELGHHHSWQRGPHQGPEQYSQGFHLNNEGEHFQQRCLDRFLSSVNSCALLVVGLLVIGE